VGTAERGAHLTASRRPGGYAGLPLAALRCSPAPMRPVRAPPSGPGTRGVSRAPEYTPPVPARLWAGRSGCELSAPSSAVERGAADRLRAAGEKALCAGAFSASAESSQPPSRSEQRRGPGLQGRAPMPERPGLPARSLARANLNADVGSGPSADLHSDPRCMRRGSREARWGN
jgi:hypothetical protein